MNLQNKSFLIPSYLYTFILYFICISNSLYSQFFPFTSQARENLALSNPAYIHPEVWMYANSKRLGKPGLQHLRLSANYLTATGVTANQLHMANVAGSLLNKFGENDQVYLLAGTNLLQHYSGNIRSTFYNARIGIYSPLGQQAHQKGVSLAFAFNRTSMQIGDLGSIILLDEEERSAITNDLGIIPSSQFGVGIFYYGRQQRRNDLRPDNSFFVGLSYQEPILKEKESVFSVDLLQFTSGFYWYFKNQKFLEFAIITKYLDERSLRFDFNVRWTMQKQAFIGVGFFSSNTFQPGIPDNPFLHCEAAFNLPYSLLDHGILTLGSGFSFAPKRGFSFLEFNISYTL